MVKKQINILCSEPICVICDDNIPFYKNICPLCFNISFLSNQPIDNIGTFEILSKIHQHKDRFEDHETVRQITILERTCLTLLYKVSLYNEKIESKCKCGYIYPRDLTFKYKEHTLMCGKCGLFCSNCEEDCHTLKENYLSCIEYKKLKDIHKEGFGKVILQSINSDMKEFQRLKDLYEMENKSKAEIFNYDLRKCPYTEWDATRTFDDYQLAFNRIEMKDALSYKYSKKDWHKVACKSIPIVKTDCDDVYCVKHNPERASKMVKVGKNKKGCGRRVEWKFWIKANAVIDDKKWFKDIQPSDVSHMITLPNIVDKGKLSDCGFCEKNNGCFSIRCLRSSCSHKYMTICGQCIYKSIKRDIKPTITITNNDFTISGTNINDLKIKGFYLNGVDVSNDVQIYENKQNIEIRKNNIIYYYFPKNIFAHLSKNVLKINVNKKNIINFYGWSYISSTITYTYKNTTLEKLSNFKCLKDNHIFEYIGLDEIKCGLADRTAFFKKQRLVASKIINRNVKKYIYKSKKIKSILSRQLVNILDMNQQVNELLFNEKQRQEQENYIADLESKLTSDEFSNISLKIKNLFFQGIKNSILGTMTR